MAELKIQNLSKTYKNGTKALQDLSLTLSNGMFGLLGPNGAGKSTLMRTIATLQEPDSGSIYFNEVDILKNKMDLRRKLGFLPQDFDFYPKTSAWEFLNHMAVLKGVTNNRERKHLVSYLLEKTNLYLERHKNLSGFSGGMKQRFGIAQALLGEPELLIVDEPTAGLDPEERYRFHNLLSEVGENIIIILSTHIVDDVRELCGRMAIIDRGCLIIEDNPGQLLEMLRGKIWDKIIEKEELINFEENYRVLSSRLYFGKMLIHVYSEKPVEYFNPVEPSLEDVYFYTINGFRSKLKGEKHAV